MRTFLCLWDILIMFWLFKAWWSTWPGNHLVSCVAELVGSCIPIHACLCLTDPKCLCYPPGLSLSIFVEHCCLVPVDDMVLFHGVVCDGWLVSYTALPCPEGSGLCTGCERVHFFLVFLDPQTNLPVCLPTVWAGAVLARHTIDQFGLLLILDLVRRMNHSVILVLVCYWAVLSPHHKVRALCSDAVHLFVCYLRCGHNKVCHTFLPLW